MLKKIVSQYRLNSVTYVVNEPLVWERVGSSVEHGVCVWVVRLVRGSWVVGDCLGVSLGVLVWLGVFVWVVELNVETLWIMRWM